MKILVINGSPHKNGTVASILKILCKSLSHAYEVEWINACDLNIQNCRSCMKCRSSGECVLPEDDGHIIGKKLKNTEALIIGTPTHWGNMSAPLKTLFDRNVPVLLGHNRGRANAAGHKREKDIIVTACTTPWPFDFFLNESRGAIRSLKKILHTSGYKTCGTIVQPGSHRISRLSRRVILKAERIGEKLFDSDFN